MSDLRKLHRRAIAACERTAAELSAAEEEATKTYNAIIRAEKVDSDDE